MSASTSAIGQVARLYRAITTVLRMTGTKNAESKKRRKWAKLFHSGADRPVRRENPSVKAMLRP